MTRPVDAPGGCPLCGGSAQAAFRVSDRNRGIVSAAPFEYDRCTVCGSYFLVDPPADLARFYPPDYHQPPDGELLERQAREEQPKLDLVQAVSAGGELLEIGPGMGMFARAAVLAGYGVTTVEMDPDCCAYLETVVGARAICSDDPAAGIAGLGFFDAIAMWHVIEHLARPWAVLEAAAGKLAPGGVLAVATPNPDAFQFRVLGARWAHVDAPRHLQLISEPALRRKAGELGLVHVRSTTTDPAGRHWNRFGWDYAVRRHPARHPSTYATQSVARALTAAARPFEGRGLAGAAYTAVFARPGG
jgi:SAM-dependent methyltransferase